MQVQKNDQLFKCTYLLLLLGYVENCTQFVEHDTKLDVYIVWLSIAKRKGCLDSERNQEKKSILINVFPLKDYKTEQESVSIRYLV